LNGWIEFGAALAAFAVSHAVPPQPAVKRRFTALLGAPGFTAGYSAISLAALAWLIVAAGHAPYVGVWDIRPWRLWLPVLAMPFAFVLLTCGVAAPNPLSFASAGKARFDPEHPGVAGVIRHPVLWAFALWAAAHLSAISDLAHVVLFALLTGFAVGGQPILDRRMRRVMGEAAWRHLAARTSAYPFAALLEGRWAPDRRGIPLLRILLGLALYVGMLLAHRTVIGVSPLPIS